MKRIKRASFSSTGELPAHLIEQPVVFVAKLAASLIGQSAFRDAYSDDRWD